MVPLLQPLLLLPPPGFLPLLLQLPLLLSGRDLRTCRVVLTFFLCPCCYCCLSEREGLEELPQRQRRLVLLLHLLLRGGQ